ATRVCAPPRAVRTPSKTVAIVIPLSADPRLTPEEEISLRQVSRVLGVYDKYLVTPDGLDVAKPGFHTVRFPRKFFGSAAAHARLMLRPEFYRTFEDYTYILIYHLDSLVLSDDLARWCLAGWDYIGAPWMPCDDTPWVREPRVGNGGFTLMHVGCVLRVLTNR